MNRDYQEFLEIILREIAITREAIRGGSESVQKELRDTKRVLMGKAAPGAGAAKRGEAGIDQLAKTFSTGFAQIHEEIASIKADALSKNDLEDFNQWMHSRFDQAERSLRGGTRPLRKTRRRGKRAGRPSFQK